LLQFAHVGCFEWHRAKEHRVEHDASAPDVGLEPAISLPFEHFRRDVGWGTALLMLYLILALHQLANSKIANLYIALGREQNVVQFDVPVEHALAVHVHQPLDELAEHMLRQILLELPSSAHVGEQVTTAADLHDVNRVRVGVEALIKAHDILVAGTLQNVILLHDLFE